MNLFINLYFSANFLDMPLILKIIKAWTVQFSTPYMYGIHHTHYQISSNNTLFHWLAESIRHICTYS